MAQFIDFVVDGRILFDIRIGRSDVGFRLIKIVITDEIADFVIREEGLEFAAQLGCQGLVVGDDQRRLLYLFDEFSHGKGLAGPRRPEEDLGPLAGLDAFGQGFNSLGLVPHRFIRGDDAEGMGRIVIFIIMRHIHKGHLAAAVGCGQNNYLLTIFPMFFNSMDKVPSGLLMKRIKSVFSIYSDGKVISMPVSVLILWLRPAFWAYSFSIATTSGSLASATCC